MHAAAQHITTPSQIALAASLIGRPWAPGACGPASFNCWGLVRYWQAQAEGVDMGDVAIAVDTLRRNQHAAGALAAEASADQMAAIIAAARDGGWRPREAGAAARAGDILMLRHGETGLRHVGVVLLVDGVLHLLHCEGSPTQPWPGVICEPLCHALERYTRPEPWRRAA